MLNMILSDTEAVRFASAGQFIAAGASIHPRRTLPTAVLLVGVSGRYPIAQEGRGYDLAADTFMLLFPFREHMGTALSEGSQSHYWCHFTVPDSARYADGPAPESDSLSLPEFGRLKHPERTALLFRQLIDASERAYAVPAAREELCSLYTRILLREIAEDALEESGGRARSGRAVVERVKEHLRVHAAEEIALGDVAARFHYNADYLAHIFHQETGLTMCGYLLAERIAAAQKLLLETGLSVTAVAGACGFGDEKYFMRAFKRRVGITPSQFRRAHCRLHTNIK